MAKKTRMLEAERIRLKDDKAMQEALAFHIMRAPVTIYQWANECNKAIHTPAVVEFVRNYIIRHPKPIEQEA